MHAARAVLEPAAGYDIAQFRIRLLRMDPNESHFVASLPGGCGNVEQGARQGRFVVHVVIGWQRDDPSPRIALEHREVCQHYVDGRTPIARLHDDVVTRQFLE